MKSNYSNKILKILSGKKASSLPEIRKEVKDCEPYALTRALKSLEKGGFIEKLESGQGEYARLTKTGRFKANSQKLTADSSVLNPSWDGNWRIILLDLPESRKAERESLRYLLKKAGFVLLKNSAWISPYPFEFLFENIKKDLELTTELMIFVTDKLDEETEKEIMRVYFS